MDAKQLFWTVAWLNMLAIVLFAGAGVRQVRHNDIAGHRRRMLQASSLVLAFLVSYILKAVFLGKEDLDRWLPFYVTVLRIHELFVLFMVISGAVALALAWRLKLLEAADGSRSGFAPERAARRIALHRRAGKFAIVSAILGLLTAAVVLFGMYVRAG